MNNKHLTIIILLLVVLLISMFYLNHRIEQIDLANSENKTDKGNVIFLCAFITTINIEKVEGDGNAFGDNNNIENMIA